jgi:formiminotetrahydrofolate cyclodeaminase
MQRALKIAAAVPLDVAETALQILPLAEAAAKRGNTNAVTDAMVSAMMARAAVLGALYNVKINLGSIKDAAFVAQTTQKVDALAERAAAMEEAVLCVFPLHS